jgi:hypothetical protein
MSDKKMLNEATIRKMMKLANIPALSEKFIQENYYDYPPVSEQEDEVEVEDELVLDAPVDDLEVDAEVEVEEPDLGVEVAEELVKDLMGVIEDHFPEVEINVDDTGEEEVEMDAEVDLEEPLPEEPPVDLGGEEELGMDAEVEEEEPVMETDLEEEESFGAGIADAAGEEEEVEADKAFMEEEILDEEEDDSAHSKLIDAIAAKVAERLLAEAKKTSK